MQTQYGVLGCRVDFYFQDHKLVIEADENGYNDRNIDYAIKREKAIEQGLGCEIIRFDPYKEDFDIFNAINEIFIRYIKQSFNQ